MEGKDDFFFSFYIGLSSSKPLHMHAVDLPGHSKVLIFPLPLKPFPYSVLGNRFQNARGLWKWLLMQQRGIAVRKKKSPAVCMDPACSSRLLPLPVQYLFSALMCILSGMFQCFEIREPSVVRCTQPFALYVNPQCITSQQ